VFLDDILQYIGPNCELEVNLDAASKAMLVAKVASNEADISMFDKLQAVLEKEMAGDLLPRFVKSPAWAALLRLDSEIDGDSIKHTDSPTTPSGGMLSGLFKSKKAPAPPTSPPPVSITIDRVAFSNTLRRAALLGNAALVATTINNGANVNDADPVSVFVLFCFIVKASHCCSRFAEWIYCVTCCCMRWGCDNRPIAASQRR
jgi:Regulator of G protein signaling domain